MARSARPRLELLRHPRRTIPEATDKPSPVRGRTSLVARNTSKVWFTMSLGITTPVAWTENRAVDRLRVHILSLPQSKVCVPPPLTNSTCPPTQLEIGAAKQSTAPAMSSAYPSRCTGLRQRHATGVVGDDIAHIACVSLVRR